MQRFCLATDIWPHLGTLQLCKCTHEQAVMHACVCVSRGGGEYGIKWREAGSLRNKQNVFDDFAACAEHLIASNYCSASKLIIQGGSNGGGTPSCQAHVKVDARAAAIMLYMHLHELPHTLTTC